MQAKDKASKLSKSSIEEKDIESYQVPPELSGQRLDQVLLHFYPDLSRSRLQNWIKNQQVSVDGEVINKPKHKLQDLQRLAVSPLLVDQGEWLAEDIPFDVHYEDDDLIIVNKRAGLVVHPAAGHYSDTLVNGLLFRYPELKKIPRAGIVHRLDKDTTGLLVVAKNLESHNHLVSQLQDRAFDRQYLALVHHTIVAGDSIYLPMGRHPQTRKKMAVIEDNESRSKEAITHFRIAEKFKHFTLLNVNLETGRTHQIRVHFSYLKHPLVGDQLYAPKNLRPRAMSTDFANIFDRFKRQALHAESLGLVHPKTGDKMSWRADLPEDFENLLNAMRQFDR